MNESEEKSPEETQEDESLLIFPGDYPDQIYDLDPVDRPILSELEK